MLGGPPGNGRGRYPISSIACMNAMSCASCCAVNELEEPVLPAFVTEEVCIALLIVERPLKNTPYQGYRIEYGPEIFLDTVTCNPQENTPRNLAGITYVSETDCGAVLTAAMFLSCCICAEMKVARSALDCTALASSAAGGNGAEIMLARVNIADVADSLAVAGATIGSEEVGAIVGAATGGRGAATGAGVTMTGVAVASEDTAVAESGRAPSANTSARIDANEERAMFMPSLYRSKVVRSPVLLKTAAKNPPRGIFCRTT